MTYDETIHYLYTRVPMFQRSGASAYKPGLGTSQSLDNYLGNPHRAYRTIHVAGTNGKGSVSHLLAAILAQAGYRVGLYTSPHLVDFRERIRVNGAMIPQAYVANFVEQHRSFFEPLSPSFFELTSTLAFDYFRHEQVDFAIIEVGLGGRLDSTNLITPLLSIITNISLDHTQFLGNTLAQIAAEKAGIIKPAVPALVGEGAETCTGEVFRTVAKAQGAPLYFAQQMEVATHMTRTESGWEIASTHYGLLHGELGGLPQAMNNRTVLAALHLLTTSLGVVIPEQAVRDGFSQVTSLTGLMGRWQVVSRNPLVVCDTGHNVGGWEHLSRQLTGMAEKHPRLHLVVGMVNDKDIAGVLALMPPSANYYFTQASVERALPAEEFARQAAAYGLVGKTIPSVAQAVAEALRIADPEDLVFIGGSTFVVADALPLFSMKST